MPTITVPAVGGTLTGSAVTDPTGATLTLSHNANWISGTNPLTVAVNTGSSSRTTTVTVTATTPVNPNYDGQATATSAWTVTQEGYVPPQTKVNVDFYYVLTMQNNMPYDLDCTFGGTLTITGGDYEGNRIASGSLRVEAYTSDSYTLHWTGQANANSTVTITGQVTCDQSTHDDCTVSYTANVGTSASQTFDMGSCSVVVHD